MPSNSFLLSEKQRQARFKRESVFFSEEAQAPGLYGRTERPFCLPRASADENLFVGLREAALSYFQQAAIRWHQGEAGSPSNHLCSSQVCCVNFLAAFLHDPVALAALFRPLYPSLCSMLPVEEGGNFVAFEWIGAENYLRERTVGRRTRGANATSADAMVRFVHEGGEVEVVLIEWKYTEQYAFAPCALSQSGTDRTLIYRHLFERADFPLDKELLPTFADLYFEPFYQLFRQQCLAQEMEIARELDADVVSVLHIAPAANEGVQRVTSPALRPLGSTITEVWSRVLRRPDRFTSVATESLFGLFPHQEFPRLQPWWAYITTRYGWSDWPSTSRAQP